MLCMCCIHRYTVLFKRCYIIFKKKLYIRTISVFNDKQTGGCVVFTSVEIGNLQVSIIINNNCIDEFIEVIIFFFYSLINLEGIRWIAI